MELKPALLEGRIGKYERHGKYEYLVKWQVNGRQGEEYGASIATIVGKMFKIYQKRKCTGSNFVPYSNDKLYPPIVSVNDNELDIFNLLFELIYAKNHLPVAPGNNSLKMVS